MSKLSEQIEAVLSETRSTTGKAEVVEASSHELLRLPGFEAMREYYVRESLKYIRRVYREMSGDKPFESPTDALTRTYNPMVEKVVTMLVSTFSDGIQMGQETSFPFKKYRMFGKLDEVFENSGWREESALIGISINDDPESRVIFLSYIAQAMTHLGMASGFADSETPEAFNKIWDVWGLAMNSCVIGCYKAGLSLGEIWAENDTLAGILAASVQEDS